MSPARMANPSAGTGAAGSNVMPASLAEASVTLWSDLAVRREIPIAENGDERD